MSMYDVQEHETEKLWCNECKLEVYPKFWVVNENTDADGNRGMMVTYIECPICGNEDLKESEPDEE
jgi:predicted nucleic-acid-binding Zn-ribbon protein